MPLGNQVLYSIHTTAKVPPPAGTIVGATSARPLAPVLICVAVPTRLPVSSITWPSTWACQMSW